MIPFNSKNTLDLFAHYLTDAFDCPGIITLPSAEGQFGQGSLLVCHASGDLRDTSEIIAGLRSRMERSPVALVTCERGGLMSDPTRWKLRLQDYGLNVAFTGWMPRDPVQCEHQTLIAVLESNSAPSRSATPADFRVVAFMAVYNEEDIIDQTIRYYIQQGIEVYILDNWSTDSSFEQASAWLGRGLIGIERFPAGRPALRYEWRPILNRIEQLSGSISADWFVLHDCDERRRSPWPEISYKAGIYHADRCGFNCIDHVVLNYSPTEDRFDSTQDLEQQLNRCRFSDHPGHFHQRKAWKNLGAPVLLAATAGHDVSFENRRVYPLKFLLKHYPIRSQAQAEKKIFRDRMPRWDPNERALGWHAQYDGIGPGHRFASDPSGLLDSDTPSFYEHFLIERLSGIGVFLEAPDWATPPVAGRLSHAANAHGLQG